jgi:hypothetical protein
MEPWQLMWNQASQLSPKATSSLNKETKLKSDKNQHKIKIGNQVRKPFKFINVNFQSICNKKPHLLEIINSVKPDIIIGTETWYFLVQLNMSS